MLYHELSTKKHTQAETAGLFISLMSDLEPQMLLDYTYESVMRLEAFIARHFDKNGGQVAETLPQEVGAYLGETIIRTIGGHWAESGLPEVHDVGPIEVLYPFERASQRFQEGARQSLSWYYQSILRQVHQPAAHAGADDAQGQKPRKNDGFWSRLLGLFGG